MFMLGRSRAKIQGNDLGKFLLSNVVKASKKISDSTLILNSWWGAYLLGILHKLQYICIQTYLKLEYPPRSSCLSSTEFKTAQHTYQFLLDLIESHYIQNADFIYKVGNLCPVYDKILPWVWLCRWFLKTVFHTDTCLQKYILEAELQSIWEFHQELGKTGVEKTLKPVFWRWFTEEKCVLCHLSCFVMLRIQYIFF